jgi:hypothetical protein
MSDESRVQGRPAGRAASRTVGMTRRDVLRSGGVLAVLAGTTGRAGADPTGQVGTAGDPLAALYTAALNGPVTDEGSGPQAVTDLAGEALSAGSGALSASDARPDVSDGTTTVQTVETLSFAGLTVTDDGDGTVSIDR